MMLIAKSLVTGKSITLVGAALAGVTAVTSAKQALTTAKCREVAAHADLIIRSYARK